MAALLLATQDVFISGTEGFDTFRIPAMTVASNGDLLAFAEGRKSTSDQAGNKLVLKRRPKGSKAWGPLEIIADDGDASLNNPCVLALPRGRVILMYQRYPAGVHESNALAGYEGSRILRSFVLESLDNGKHWKAPVDITREAKRDETIRTLASGPGIGIRLSRGKHRGRLVFPFNEKSGPGWDVFALISDDGGKTWKAGRAAPQGEGVNGNEVQMAEIGPDQILLNARNQGKDHHRYQAISRDGGESWEELRAVPSLPDPVCMGSLIGVGGLLYFSNPSDQSKRSHGMLYSSSDHGTTWKAVYSFGEASFSYSSLALPERNRLGCLYETVTRCPDGREGYILRYQEIDTR